MTLKDYKRKLKKEMASFLEIPREVALDLPKLTLIGNMQIFIENHRGIVEYTFELIKINVEEYILAIKGENLQISTITSEEICIEGKIFSINFEG